MYLYIYREMSIRLVENSGKLVRAEYYGVKVILDSVSGRDTLSLYRDKQHVISIDLQYVNLNIHDIVNAFKAADIKVYKDKIKEA